MANLNSEREAGLESCLWKKGATEFKVAVHKNEKRVYYTGSIPTPVIEHLGKGKDVEAITYRIKGKRIEVEAEHD